MEMIEILQRKKVGLTAREYSVIWFLVGQLQGNLLKTKLIKTDEFTKATELPRQHVSTTIESLIEKGVITRQTGTMVYGSSWYGFNEKFFTRVIATKEVFEDKRGLRLINGGKEDRTQKSYAENSNRTQASDGFLQDRTQTSDAAPIENSIDSLREIYKSPEVKPGSFNFVEDEDEIRRKSMEKYHLQKISMGLT